MTITIADFMELCTESAFCTVEIFDLDKGEILWTGTGYDIPDEYAGMEICSFDAPSEAYKMTFNVSAEENEW